MEAGDKDGGSGDGGANQKQLFSRLRERDVSSACFMYVKEPCPAACHPFPTCSLLVFALSFPDWCERCEGTFMEGTSGLFSAKPHVVSSRGKLRQAPL